MTALCLTVCAAATGGAAVQLLAPISPLDRTGRVTFAVDEGAPASGFRPGDRQLAVWALQDWERALGGRLRFEPATADAALIRVRWAAAGDGQYGEMRPIVVGGRRGAEVFIRPDTDALGPEIATAARQDPLLRDTIVYLTCLHELGHALGLRHTDVFDDVMYFFGYGGDIPGFFGRYRARLRTLDDMARASGLSQGDRTALDILYPTR